MTQRKINAAKRHFRILRDWDIRPSRSIRIGGQCSINPHERRAVVYPWNGNTPEPRDYVLHEILHCALRALTRMDRRRPKDVFLAEEELVQDLCALMRPTLS